jgi:hypothetical protein
MKNFIRDMLEQVWTLLGMFIAWFVLDGSARAVVGWAILWSTIVWVGSYWVRNPKE